MGRQKDYALPQGSYAIRKWPYTPYTSTPFSSCVLVATLGDGGYSRIHVLLSVMNPNRCGSYLAFAPLHRKAGGQAGRQPCAAANSAQGSGEDAAFRRTQSFNPSSELLSYLVELVV